MSTCIMSMGAYDEGEHERRAEMASRVDAEFSETRADYRGTVDVDAGESTEALLDQFREIKGQ